MILLEDGSVDVSSVDRVTQEDLVQAGNTQLALALRRLRIEPATTDPEAAVARFDSAW